jgi:hypothetical protein
MDNRAECAVESQAASITAVEAEGEFVEASGKTVRKYGDLVRYQQPPIHALTRADLQPLPHREGQLSHRVQHVVRAQCIRQLGLLRRGQAGVQVEQLRPGVAGEIEIRQVSQLAAG